MEVKIEEYLIKERGVDSPVVRRMLYDKVMKYDDIAKGFKAWLETKEYVGPEVEGYSAEMIHELAPHLEGIGVYNFLVTLRDNPGGAKRIIDEGFVIK